MKNLLSILLLLMSVFSLNAQIIQVTGTGTITGTSGFGSSASVGSAFSYAFTFNTALPSLSSSSYEVEYNDPQATFSVSFGDNTLSYQDVTIETSDIVYYGYQAQSSQSLNLTLFSSSSSYGPNLSLNDIKSFSSGSVYNFENLLRASDLSKFVNGDNPQIAGTINTAVVTTPEPSNTILLLLGSLMLFFVARLRKMLLD